MDRASALYEPIARISRIVSQPRNHSHAPIAREKATTNLSLPRFLASARKHPVTDGVPKLLQVFPEFRSANVGT